MLYEVITELYNTCGQQLQLVQVNGSYSAQLHVQDRQPGLYLLKVQFTVITSYSIHYTKLYECIHKHLINRWIWI